MKITKFKFAVVAGVMSVLSCFGLYQRSVYAGSNSMTISPPKQRIILIPGEKYSNVINVFNSNDSTRDLKFEASVGSFSQKKDDEKKDDKNNDDYGVVDIVSESSYNQIMEWITIENPEGTVAPGKSVNVYYTIDVPKNAPAGGQYATIVVADKTTSGAGGEGNVSIDQTFQFASIIYAEVAGETKEDGEIMDNSMPSFLLNGPLTASSMVKNSGNVHTDAEYTLQVWPLFSGEEVCTNEENPDTSLILPDTERYHAQTCDLPSFGIFKAKQVVKIFGETSTVERTIIVCPLWLLFVIVFIIALLIGWVFFRIRNRRGRSRED